MRREIARLALAVALLSVGVARAESQGAAALLRDAPYATVQAIRTAPASLRALEELANGSPSRVLPETLRAVLASPTFAPFAADTIRDLATVKNVPGVELVLKRLVGAPPGNTAGASFEINVGARFGAQLAELSSNIMVTDHVTGLPKAVEVDARLHDGTLVEVKYDTSGFAFKLGSKGIDQLILRKWSQPKGLPVALVTNFPLHPMHAERAQQHGILVYRASRYGGALVLEKPTRAAQPQPGASHHLN